MHIAKPASIYFGNVQIFFAVWPNLLPKSFWANPAERKVYKTQWAILLKLKRLWEIYASSLFSLRMSWLKSILSKGNSENNWPNMWKNRWCPSPPPTLSAFHWWKLKCKSLPQHDAASAEVLVPQLEIGSLHISWKRSGKRGAQFWDCYSVISSYPWLTTVVPCSAGSHVCSCGLPMVLRPCRWLHRSWIAAGATAGSSACRLSAWLETDN